MALVLITVGLIILTVGAELLVRGASGLARAFGLPSLIIGLTVVAFGTSAPEFAVSLKAGLSGQADIALGNVIGSNIFNVLCILGVSAMILPLSVSSQLVRLDVPVMVAVSVLTWLFAVDMKVSRWEGMVLVAGMIIYSALLIRMGMKKPVSCPDGYSSTDTHNRDYQRGMNTLLVVTGLVLLVMGARWFVSGAVDLAMYLGVSELLVGLTIVAAGTSLPELATSVVAAIRGERDIAVGNVVGSNIFNILFVLGTSALLSGQVSVDTRALHVDLPVMTVVAVVCLPIFFTGGRISRWEGALFTGYYIAYITYLILTVSMPETAELFGRVALWFAVPVTLLVLSISLFSGLRTQRRLS